MARPVKAMIRGSNPRESANLGYRSKQVYMASRNPTGKGGFKKGQSGNPSGRPKVVADIRELARQHGPKAIETLAHLMFSGDERTQVAAAQALLDRGFGKPSQAMELSGPEGGPIQTATELIDRPPRETLEEWQARRKKELEKK